MKTAKIIAVWVVFAAILLSIFWGFHETDDVQIPIRNDMERAVMAQSVAVVLSDSMPQFDREHTQVLSSEEFFLKNIPDDNATIYVSFQQERTAYLEKMYWTVVNSSNGANLIVYTDVYRLRKYSVKDYTGDTVFFHYDNFFNDWFGFVLFIAFIFGFCLVFWLGFLIYDPPRKDKKGAA